MLSAFGIEHVSKGLPSAIKHAPVGSFKPLSVSGLKQTANVEGRFAGKQQAIARKKRSGWTTNRMVAGNAMNAGRTAAREAKRQVM